MSMDYDYAVYEKFRQRAVTDIDDILVGNRYYTNAGDSFVVKRLMTNAEYYDYIGLKWINENAANDIEWVIAEGRRHFSLSDHGVTDRPYNPWLIFESERDRNDCVAHLTITHVFDPHDDYDYNLYDYDED